MYSNNEMIENDTQKGTIITEMQKPDQQLQNQQPSLVNLLNDPSLKICYKCGHDFSKEVLQSDDEEDQNILLGGIVLSQQTPSSICLSCLCSKMLDFMTGMFTKNGRDYSGLFSTYMKNLKV